MKNEDFYKLFSQTNEPILFRDRYDSFSELRNQLQLGIPLLVQTSSILAHSLGNKNGSRVASLLYYLLTLFLGLLHNDTLGLIF